MPTRREKLEAMLTATPNDQTLRYMLGLELEKEGNPERSLELLIGLQSDSTPYVPAFLMAGQQLTKLGRTADAIATYERGIKEAERQGNAHASGEMLGFLNMIRST